MAQAKNGDKVRVHYTGTLDDGSIFDSSEETESGCGDDCGDDCGDHDNDCGDHDCGCGGNAGGPMEFVIGQGNLIPKFESAVIGLEPGQSVTVKIAADDSYGQRAEEMVAVIERSEIPADMKPQVGRPPRGYHAGRHAHAGYGDRGYGNHDHAGCQSPAGRYGSDL